MTTTIKIETKEELRYMMQFLGIPYVRIMDGGNDMGKVTRDMKYEPGFYRYKSGYVGLAFDIASRRLSQDYELLQEWKEESKKTYITRLLYGTYKGEKKAETGYCWKSDFEKCHIAVSKDVNGCLLLQGRVNDLKNFCSYANDHMKYCQEGYYLESVDVNALIELSDRYGLKNAGDDDYDPYRIGIVD